MVALHGLGRADVAWALAQRLLPLARERTHAISEAHLACAAEGEAAGVLHEAIASVCSEGTAMLRNGLCALNRFGHTSGWDGLAGAAAVFGAYVRSRCRGKKRNHAQELQ